MSRTIKSLFLIRYELEWRIGSLVATYNFIILPPIRFVHQQIQKHLHKLRMFQS